MDEQIQKKWLSVLVSYIEKHIPGSIKGALGLIAGVIILVSSVSCLFGKWQWWEVFLIIFSMVIVVIIASFLIKHIEERNRLDKKNLETYKEVQESLKKTDSLVMLIDVFEKIMDTIEEPKKSELKRKISHLKEQIVYEIPKEIGVWKRAGRWLEENYKNFVKEAIEQTMNELKELGRIGGCLNSEEQREQFQKSIDEHLLCILHALHTLDSNYFKELEHKKHVCERRAYKKVFLNLHKIIKDHNNSLDDNDASDLLLKIFKELSDIMM